MWFCAGVVPIFDVYKRLFVHARLIFPKSNKILNSCILERQNFHPDFYFFSNLKRQEALDVVL